MMTIKDVKPYEFNVKDHPDIQVELIAKVIKEIGWRIPVEINQEGTIINGHGRWIVWEKYKDDPEMPAIWIIDDMGQTIHGKHDERPLNEEQQTMWRIADNKLTELATWNLGNYSFEMDKLQLDEYKQMTGFDSPQLEEINDVEMEWEGMPEINNTGDKIQGAYKSVIVHFESEEDMKDFSIIIGQKITDKTKYVWHPYKPRDDIKSQEFIKTDDYE